MIKLKESVNEESKTIKSIQNLADKNKYGTVSGTRMNGKTAKEIIAIYNHPKMKSFRGKMDKMKSHELMDLTIRLPKMLGIKVESVNEKMGPKELHAYMQHVFDTQFKTADDKKMKKILIKKLNNIQKKKGRPLFKESINEVSGVDVAKKVLKNKQMEKGLDLQTANLIVTIDKAYDKNPRLQKKFRAIKLPKMKQLILKFGR